MARHTDIEYLIRFFSASYGSSITNIRIHERAADYILHDDPDDPEGVLEFCRATEEAVDNNATMASAALATLVEIQQSMPEEEWWVYRALMPEVLNPLAEDMAKYEALLAFDAAGVSLPTEEDPGIFLFGQFNETPVTSTKVK